jgi:hypothetical protein
MTTSYAKLDNDRAAQGAVISGSSLVDAVTVQSDMVLVPRRPTAEMLHAGWASANEEDAAGVWRDMIEEWESTMKDGEFSNGQRFVPSFPKL